MEGPQRWLDKLRLRLRSLFLQHRVDQELQEEFQYHLERQIDENLRHGMAPREARRAATVRLHGIVQRKEECRDARGISFVEHSLADFQYGLRLMRKHPGFALAVVATLAL